MKDLVKIIKANPGCVASIDNDWWCLNKAPPKPISEMTNEEHDKWGDTSELVSSSDEIKPLGDGGYGSGNCYSGDLLQALAQIVGIKVESV